MKKYGMIPSQSFLQDISSCAVGMLPENFYQKVGEGSIIIRKSQSFSFCKQGLLIEGETQPLETDIVILATGYRGDKKLKDIFKSPIFQKQIVNGSPTSIVPLYRLFTVQFLYTLAKKLFVTADDEIPVANNGTTYILSTLFL